VEFHVLGGLGFRGFDLAEADEDHGAELKALAALHGENIDLGFPGIVGPLAAAGGHEQVGDAERLELMGDPFSVVRLHAYHGDVAEEIPALVPGLIDAARGEGDLVAYAGKLP